MNSLNSHKLGEVAFLLTLLIISGTFAIGFLTYLLYANLSETYLAPYLFGDFSRPSTQRNVTETPDGLIRVDWDNALEKD